MSLSKEKFKYFGTLPISAIEMFRDAERASGFELCGALSRDQLTALLLLNEAISDASTGIILLKKRVHIFANLLF
jgi:hypothetical protein